MEMITISR